jgi:predicted transcriptional regulator
MSCSHTASEMVDVSNKSSTSPTAVPIAELQEAGIVQQNEDVNYALTQLGNNLLQALAPLNDWAHHWAERERLHRDQELM